MSENHWVLFFEVEIDLGGREVEKDVAIAAMLWEWGYSEDESLSLRVEEENRPWVQSVWSHHTNSRQPTCTLVFQEEKYTSVLLKSVIFRHPYYRLKLILCPYFRPNFVWQT